MPLIFSVLILVWDKVQRKKWSGRNPGEWKWEWPKNKRKGITLFQREGREAIGKAWSTQKRKNQEETEWTRNRTAESGLYEWNRRIKSVSSFQEWMFNTCSSATCAALLQPRRHLVSVTFSEEPHPQLPPLKYFQHIPCTHRSSPWSQ